MKVFPYKYKGRVHTEIVELIKQNGSCPYCTKLLKEVTDEGVTYLNDVYVRLLNSGEAIIKCRCKRIILDK